MYIRPPSCLSRRASIESNPVFPPSLSLSLTRKRAFSHLSATACETAVRALCRSLTLVISRLTLTYTHTHTPFSPSLFLGRHFHPRSTYLRYNTSHSSCRRAGAQ